MKKTLTCHTHGRAPWSGAVFCPTCRTCYQTHDSESPRYAPLQCCGRRFMPPTSGSGKFSALPICDGCAKESGLVFPDTHAETIEQAIEQAIETGNVVPAPTGVLADYQAESKQLCNAIEKVLSIPGSILFVSDMTTVDDFLNGIVGEKVDLDSYHERLTRELGVPVSRHDTFVAVCRRMRARTQAGLS